MSELQTAISVLHPVKDSLDALISGGVAQQGVVLSLAPKHAVAVRDALVLAATALREKSYQAIPCKYCRDPLTEAEVATNEDDSFLFIHHDKELRFMVDGHADSFPINNCPWCGRKL